MKIAELNNGLQVVLTEMCKRVGAEVNLIDFKDGQWFMQHEWTEAEEADFVKWLADYLFLDRQARIDIMNSPYKRKVSCHKAAKSFVWNYGWKTIKPIA